MKNQTLKTQRILKAGFLMAGLLLVSLPVFAQRYGDRHDDGYRGDHHSYRGYRGRDDLGVAIVTGILGGVIYNSIQQNNYQPRYYNPPRYYNQPSVVYPPQYQYPSNTIVYGPPVYYQPHYQWDPYLGKYVLVQP